MVDTKLLTPSEEREREPERERAREGGREKTLPGLKIGWSQGNCVWSNRSTR
jgi:hypothetical protein